MAKLFRIHDSLDNNRTGTIHEQCAGVTVTPQAVVIPQTNGTLEVTVVGEGSNYHGFLNGHWYFKWLIFR